MAYAISKHFVIWFAKTDAARFGEKNVRLPECDTRQLLTRRWAYWKAGRRMYSKNTLLSSATESRKKSPLCLALLLDERLGFLTGADILMDGGVVASGASGLSK